MLDNEEDRWGKNAYFRNELDTKYPKKQVGCEISKNNKNTEIRNNDTRQTLGIQSTFANSKRKLQLLQSPRKRSRGNQFIHRLWTKSFNYRGDGLDKWKELRFTEFYIRNIICARLEGKRNESRRRLGRIDHCNNEDK